MSAVGELTQMVSSRKKGGAKEKHPDNKPALVFKAKTKPMVVCSRLRLVLWKIR